MTTEDSGHRRDGRMTLSEHLVELRKRLFRAAAGFVLGIVIAWFLTDPVMNAMREPVTAITKNQSGRQAMLNYDTITGAFDLKFQLAMIIGAFISSPIWLYQLWSFFVPALTKKELKYGFGFFFTALPLFLLGGFAGWLLVPHMVSLLTSFAPSEDSAIINAKTYFVFIMKFVLLVGVAFVLPVFLVLLNFVGVLSAQSIIRSWRWAIIAITLFTAITTPAADVISMFLLAIPMAALYFCAYGVAWLHDRRAAKRADAFDASIAV